MRYPAIRPAGRAWCGPRTAPRSRWRGFLAEAHATRDAHDITSFGGWRRFLAEQAES
jgi:allophanate hydrolase